MSQTILVTGGAGFIGSHLCERLTQDGHRIISLDNYSTGTKENHLDGVEYRVGHTKEIARLVPEAVDLVYHLGEYSRVEQSFAAIKQVLDFNTIGTHAVLEYVREHGGKLVYAGSSTKFADGGLGRDQSPYAWTKAANTELVRNYGSWFTIPYAITYFYNVYGPRERGDTHTGTVIGIFAEKMAAGEPLTVHGSGAQRRNFTHVYDIIDGLIRVGERGEGDDYGIGHPETYSILEVAQMFGGEIVLLPNPPGNRTNSTADTTRTRLELMWRPQYNLPDYIAHLSS